MDREKAIVYICDPEKNTSCKKTGCLIRGGECYLTTDISHAFTIDGVPIKPNYILKLLENLTEKPKSRKLNKGNNREGNV